MKLNEAKIKKKRHKSLDPWRLYVPDWSRTSGLLLRSRPDTMKPGATQCKKILGNTRFFTVSNPIWYHAS